MTSDAANAPFFFGNCRLTNGIRTSTIRQDGVTYRKCGSKKLGVGGLVGGESNRETWSDGQLVAAYLEADDQAAFEVLMNRHYSKVHRRVTGLVYDYKLSGDQKALAEDQTQASWVKVVTGLDSYKDDGKFINWLYTICRNVVNDYAKAQGIRIDTVSSTLEDDEGGTFSPYLNAADIDNVEASAIYRDEINYLTEEVLPRMPVNQRVIFLLRFESNLWEQGQPLTWDHLATLNGVTTEVAWQRFEEARAALLRGVPLEEIDPEQLLIFLVWSQANRPDKSINYTIGYFAKLLGVTDNTLKTRLRAADKFLEEGRVELKEGATQIGEDHE